MASRNSRTSSTDIKLAQLRPDGDTRALFGQLLKEADKGEIVGAVVIVLCHRKHGGKHYYMHLAGRAATNLTYTTGAMAGCGTLLTELALQQAGLK
jgi:hypothetical protein